MSDYAGDVRLIFENDGGEVQFENGQPVMDQGLYTAVGISLFTEPGWWGNRVVPAAQSIGADVETLRQGKLTNSVRLNIIEAAKAALKWLTDDGIAQSVTVDAEIPSAGRLNILVTIQEPSADQTRTLRYAVNWDSLRREA